MTGNALLLMASIAIGGEMLIQLPGASERAELKAALLMRVLELEANLAAKAEPITIYVIGAPVLAEALKSLVGKRFGAIELGSVVEGSELPAARPDAIFLGTAKNIDAILSYTRFNKVLSATDRADVFNRGTSVAIFFEKRHPKIQLNPNVSLDEGLDWRLDFRDFRAVTLELKAPD